MKLTPWFDETVKPFRPGIYECWNRTDGPNETYFYYWDGNRWEFGGFISPETVSRCNVASDQFKKWRGLAEDPNA